MNCENPACNKRLSNTYNEYMYSNRPLILCDDCVKEWSLVDFYVMQVDNDEDFEIECEIDFDFDDDIELEE